MKHHAIISGTGRTGTTFLMQLLTALGLDTGFSDPQSDIFPNCDAGMERDLRYPDAPYIVKSPNLCDYLDGAITEGGIIIDHAIVPVRDLYAAAESRRDVTRRSERPEPEEPGMEPPGINGGLWGTDQPEMQEGVLLEKLYKLIHAISKHDIPLTLLYLPRLVHGPIYLYDKLGFLLREITFGQFLTAYISVARPEIVHEFDWRKADGERVHSDLQAPEEPCSDS